MFCGECGTENPEANRFCKNCGRPLRQPASGGNMAAVAPNGTALPESVPEGVSPHVPAKRRRNWIGISSLVFGILCWGIMTHVLAIAAIVTGIYSIYRRAKDKAGISVSGIIGILAALAALVFSATLR